MSPFFSPPVSEDYSDIIVRRQYLPIDPDHIFPEQIVNTQYSILYAPLSENLSTVPQIGYSGVPKLFTFQNTSSLESSGILAVQTQPYLSLSGEDILVGFLDSGIDYTHPAFIILMAQRGFLASGIRRIKAAHRLRDSFMALPTRANRSTQRFFLPAPAQSYRKQTRRGTVLPSQGLPAEALIRNPTLPAQRLEAVCFSSA